MLAIENKHVGKKKVHWGIQTTVKPLLSGHLRDLPKCLLNKGCPLNGGCKNCVIKQYCIITVIKLHVVKEAIQSEFTFITFHYQLVCKLMQKH